MDTKVLYVTAIAIAAVSGGYYYYSGKGNKLQADSARSMKYSAENINLTQTDEQGKLYIRAQVDRLEQDLQQKTSQLDNLRASTYKDGRVDATFFAKVANGYNDNEKVVLRHKVEATKLLEDGKMVFLTDELTAFPKTRELETDKQVTVQTPQAEFVSNGLKANLNDGQYEFFNIRGKYEP
ncbi:MULTISPECIES: LPS export ABC transporter periplasmic protein LptC [Acinetobacter]|jgi:lipopolysaccharide export system protein LptC|uniref:LPS export ABC transporter periplasmic protein LptC n=2 Tax=Acinetobacter TaxID=469 RepID=A0A4Q7AWH1_9GAMM|nr:MULTISPECIES: LPS export ABC transporter periplasmic protein LptC [Acinetobacter]MCW8037989.1 LPS export ABC transporter periplasmic protein LptC [Acinetobacter entericus]QXW24723.1 LPS export ABC transporter periplasmic protein LptC [Acinetobacter johnsonii]RZG67955.1 LPS export ABC transporter periplasmic protein LptC [Acinetobacter bouvetii]TCB76344.1 LPS export ABC transporter periplasmic protein LptC [Acinetobacter sp. ANC 4177]